MIDFPTLYPNLVKYLPNWSERFYPSLAQFARGEGYPCGNQGVFIPRRNKCWTHPKTGQRLKKPLTYQMYKDAKEKSQRSRTEKGRTALETREQSFRDKAREKVKGWQNKTPEPEVALKVGTKQVNIKGSPELYKELNLTHDPSLGWQVTNKNGDVLRQPKDGNLQPTHRFKEKSQAENFAKQVMAKVNRMTGKPATKSETKQTPNSSGESGKAIAVSETQKPKSHSDYYGIKSEDQKLLDASPLQGTEKQVTWAEKLRKDAIIQARLEASLYGKLLTKDNPNGEKLSVDDFKEVSDLIGKYAATKTDAKFWIDRRYNGNQSDLIKPVMTVYTEQLAEQNDPRLSDELKKVISEGKSKRIGAGQERKLLAEKYKTIQKPDLEGTERQVSWAGKIRDGFLGDAERQKIEPDSVQKALDSDELKNSKFWIDNRDMSLQGNRLSKEGIEKVKTIGGSKRDKLQTKEPHEVDWENYLKSKKLTLSKYNDLSWEDKKAHRDEWRKTPPENERGFNSHQILAQFGSGSLRRRKSKQTTCCCDSPNPLGRRKSKQTAKLRRGGNRYV